MSFIITIYTNVFNLFLSFFWNYSGVSNNLKYFLLIIKLDMDILLNILKLIFSNSLILDFEIEIVLRFII